MSDPIDRGPSRLTDELRRRIADEGFDGCGVAPARPPSRDVGRLEWWLAAGHHASMRWMERHLEPRRDPTALLPGCRHVVLVTLGYHRDDPGPGPRRGRVARYARGRDYHRVMGKRLRRLASWLAEETGAPARAFVDTGPVLERAYAERAGLGWIGKNACLIDRTRGSWFLIGEILTAAALVDDAGPGPDHCGSCNACIEACPTDAIREPGVVDARRCVSYWTIEHRGPIPVELRPGIGDWMFGCDDCQSACPWNRTFAPEAPADGPFEFRDGLRDLDPQEILALDEEGFHARFAGTPLMRSRRDGLRRNACVVLGNLGHPRAVPALVEALTDADPGVRSHAAWALGRIGGEGARAALRAAAASERDPDVLREIETGIGGLSGG